jgi:hypothetical protein
MSNLENSCRRKLKKASEGRKDCMVQQGIEFRRVTSEADAEACAELRGK